MPNLWRESEAKCVVVLDGAKTKSCKGRFHGGFIALFVRWFIVLLLAAKMAIIIVEIFRILFFRRMRDFHNG